LPPLRTVVCAEPARTIVTRNQSPDIPFEQSINPYRGCEHGCIYCYARPTHAYLGLSPGLDFESRLFFKPRAAELLKQELGRREYRCRPIALGTNTDPYQPVERDRGVTRRILKLLAECDHPVTITTKSALVERDIDLLAPMAARGLTQVFVSLATLDHRLARLLEPRAAAPIRRLRTLAVLAQAGIPVGVMAAPVIPVLTDAEMETILANAADAGASMAGYVLLRLPLEVQPLFTEWLSAHAPLTAQHVLSRLRDAHGGKTYDGSFGARMRGSGPFAELLAKRFDLACRRLGLNRSRTPLDVSRFRPPPTTPDQLDLF
jgi:DNA repair photolyase